MGNNISITEFCEYQFKNIPPELEKPYLVYQKTYDSNQDLFNATEHMLNALKDEKLLSSLHKERRSAIFDIFMLCIELTILTSSKISIYLSEKGEYAAVDMSNNNMIDMFCQELSLLISIISSASEVIVSGKETPVVSFYFDFEENPFNVNNMTKKQNIKTLNI